MSWLLTAAVVTGVFSADAQQKAGKAQQFELDRQADQEKIAGQGRELQRRERLNKLLSQSIVGQSMSGIDVEGTPSSIALSTAKKASLSEGLETLSDRLKQAQLRRQGRNTRRAGNVAAGSTLLNSGISAASLSGGGKDG